ncbi:MAG: regulatory protein RecX [Candidatus Eisenbacteria bacterium]|uniref:Regulatory protein RecX n=1 Tax=Eiseniibacteriota bacterium TaxID=2212470 RepID=A0A538SJ29_UNCEI|nr:MAG: regulatory protein RecX [Candidatus Eisenbacteria bacterium]
MRRIGRSSRGTRASGDASSMTALSDDANAAREAALKLLERTRRTRTDLERRLRDRGFAAATVAEVLDRLAGVGLVDDAEFARAFLSGRWGRRPSGWRRLVQELRARGVSPDDIARGRALLEQQVGAVDEIASARRVIAQAERRYRGLEPRARRHRLYGLLARRGYDSDTIEAALETPSAEDDERS